MVLSPPQVQTAIRDRYALPRNEVEQERLDAQHVYLTQVLCGHLIIDENVQLRPGCRVLDCGTGAGSWILALSKEVPKTTELIGVDISSAMFPKEHPGNVKLYEMSSTSLPAEWSNSFDFISQRLLLAAFTVSLWRTTLSELFRVLKPGGAIQLMEYGHFDSPYKSDSLPATKKTNDIFIAIMRKRDLLGFECGRQLPRLLKEAGFSDIHVEKNHAPLGRQWGEIGSKGARNYGVIFRGLGAALMAEGGLGVCESQVEVDKVVERAKKEWDENSGISASFYTFTAKKTS